MSLHCQVIRASEALTLFTQPRLPPAVPLPSNNHYPACLTSFLKLVLKFLSLPPLHHILFRLSPTWTTDSSASPRTTSVPPVARCTAVMRTPLAHGIAPPC